MDAIGLLGELLDRHERRRATSRAVTLRPDLDALRVADIDRLHEALRAAERAGAIRLDWGKRERAHILERIRLVDPDRLYGYLGRTPAALRADTAVAALASAVEGASSWVAELLETCRAAWRQGRRFYGLTPDDIHDTGALLRLLGAIDRQEHAGLDIRTLSRRAAGDSKAFERLKSTLVAIIQAHMGMERVPPEEVLGRLGLVKFPQPVFMAGPFVLDTGAQRVDLASVRPFFALPLPAAGRLGLEREPDYVLTVENLASFNRQVREVDAANSVVIYLGGFPAPAVMMALGEILRATSAPFFHWGDIDGGGVRIFRYLEERLPRAPRPHLMTVDLARRLGRSAPAAADLATIAASDSAIATLAAYLARDPAPMVLEQEALDPVAPPR